MYRKTVLLLETRAAFFRIPVMEIVLVKAMAEQIQIASNTYIGIARKRWPLLETLLWFHNSQENRAPGGERCFFSPIIL